MSPLPNFTPDEQFATLSVIDFISDLFTSARRENFDRASILVILNNVKSLPEIFEPAVVEAYENAIAGVNNGR